MERLINFGLLGIVIASTMVGVQIMNELANAMRVFS